MFKFIAIVSLIFYWFSIEVLGGAIDPRDDMEKTEVDKMREAELTDAEIENLLSVHRKFRYMERTTQRKSAGFVSAI